MKTLLKNGIVVKITATVIKHYKNKALHDLYRKFSVSQHGIAQKPVTVKLTKQIAIAD